MLDEFACTLDEVATALQMKDSATADAALARARSLDDLRAQLSSAVRASREVVRFSPRRRSARMAVETQQVLAAQLDLAVRNTRVLARRARRAVGETESIPPQLVEALRALARTVRALDLAARTPDDVAPERDVLHAAALANSSLCAA